MKKLIALLLAVTLCVSLAACGGAKNPDQEYVLALMEKGDYDMAIRVLENLRDQAGGSPKEEPETTEPTAAPTAAPLVLSEMQQQVLDAVNRFLEETGNTWMEQYEQGIGQAPRPVTVTHGASYVLEKWEGFDYVECLLIRLEMDVLYYDEDGNGGVTDVMYIAIDAKTGTIYNATMPQKADGEKPIYDTEAALLRHILGSYASYILYNTEYVWSSAGKLTVLSQEEIQGINKARQ